MAPGHKTRPESAQSSSFYHPEEHRSDGRALVLCAGSHWSALITLARAVQPCARQEPQHNLTNPAYIILNTLGLLILAFIWLQEGE